MEKKIHFRKIPYKSLHLHTITKKTIIYKSRNRKNNDDRNTKRME